LFVSCSILISSPYPFRPRHENSHSFLLSSIFRINPFSFYSVPFHSHLLLPIPVPFLKLRSLQVKSLCCKFVASYSRLFPSFLYLSAEFLSLYSSPFLYSLFQPLSFEVPLSYSVCLFVIFFLPSFEYSRKSFRNIS
jgi:hypothetical protein